MADILAALGELEKVDKKEKQHVKNQAVKRQPSKRGRVESGPVSEGARQTRPRSRPTPLDENNLRPPTPTNAERSPSIAGSARRISFAEEPRTETRRVYLSTKTDSLASGFEHDPRINKYNIKKEGWDKFNEELLKAAGISHGTTWSWKLQKKSVIKKVHKDLGYSSSDVSTVLRRWNNLFRSQGMSVSLLLPLAKGESVSESELNSRGDTDELREQVIKDASKRFRLVVTPAADNGESSAYSRASSLRGSVSGEAANIQQENLKDDDVEDDVVEVK